uniref:Orotidine 5'-phosphate decarboxylase n=1 Tax=Neobodo designis TaxID=312471 RepID=A0A7S1Q643_NEODS|mmetsp:Transcript_31654/g.97857  ORF Transcript_31654/g.97857 Transcript_31654/m.97857 type:complete len:462 (+) Transcript_31654:28-1413(+)|eukprot:CAMPEP_0174851876 /NCGR_PEP_ID=MMETSP1114-20130205/24288_1 /TAXON_ID=312471 /ORGANISM="Neobodo designis, Strain CCAP 1951/1" /LENGTH=461 /DNA_ID=CAMNT_0016086443 /DNA_START=28 /DNA_END=1413 /DNA_ORIENTATION=+
MSFFAKLNKRAEGSLLCVGLDPRAATAAEAEAQCLRVIEQTAPYAAAFKPNAAFFERHGEQGWASLKRVIAAIPSEIPVILDAKRGDIADTAVAYADAAFKALGAGAITLSPYMGRDTLTPFLKHADNAVFALCKTSNKGSSDLQDLSVGDGKFLYEHVARVCEQQWSRPHGNLGIVVGATNPEAMKRVRRAAPTLWFLVPGIGAQGGDLAASLKAGLRADGSGMLINVSRAVFNAPDPAAAAREMVDRINAHRNANRTGLAQALLESKCARFGTFKLKSGKMSPIYIDLRRLVTHPRILQLVAAEYAELLKTIEYDRLVGLPYAALPIATAISLHVNKPLIYPRREAKTYGTKATIEGDFNKGDRVVIIDDLVTTGETKIEAIDKLKEVGLQVVAIVVLIDREMGATQFLGSHGFNFKAVASLTDLLEQWRSTNAVTAQQYQQTKDFISSGKAKAATSKL